MANNEKEMLAPTLGYIMPDTNHQTKYVARVSSGHTLAIAAYSQNYQFVVISTTDSKDKEGYFLEPGSTITFDLSDEKDRNVYIDVYVHFPFQGLIVMYAML